jgi:hypothetical protein
MQLCVNNQDNYFKHFMTKSLMNLHLYFFFVLPPLLFVYYNICTLVDYLVSTDLGILGLVSKILPRSWKDNMYVHILVVSGKAVLKILSRSWKRKRLLLSCRKILSKTKSDIIRTLTSHSPFSYAYTAVYKQHDWTYIT